MNPCLAKTGDFAGTIHTRNGPPKDHWPQTMNGRIQLSQQASPRHRKFKLENRIHLKHALEGAGAAIIRAASSRS
eukprot:scaffold276680_cov18-Prasinocladus_malaysianus.AAC.1